MTLQTAITTQLATLAAKLRDKKKQNQAVCREILALQAEIRQLKKESGKK